MAQMHHHLGSDSEKSEVPQMVNASCQWSPQPDSLPESESEVDADEVDKEAILAEEQYELLRQSALRRQLSAGQQRLLAQKHLVAVAAMQQRRDDISQKQRITSTTGDQIVPLQFRDKPLQVEGERPDSESPFMTSHIIRPTSRCVSTSDLPPDVSRVSEPGGSVSATFGGKSVLDCDFRAAQSNSEGLAATYRSPRPFSGNNKKGQSKHSTVPSSTETLIKINKTHHPQSELTKQTTISAANKEHYYTTKNYEETNDFLSPNGKKQILQKGVRKESDNILDMLPNVKPHRELQRLPWENQKNEMQHSDRLSLKANTADDSHIVTSLPLPKTVAPSTSKHGIVDSRSINRISGGKFSDSHSGQGSSEEGLSPKHKVATAIPREESTLSLPPKLRTINQAMMKGLVKGEVVLPPSTEVPLIPPGIKKTTSFVMESDPDSLSIQSNRYYAKSSTPDKITDGHSNRMRAKNYETTEDSFFGMSDRVGMSMKPRNGRVPPVVANIAELRRSLMGQGREVNEHPRKIVTQSSEDNVHRHDDGIPFSQRPKRKNGLLKQQNQKPISNHLPPKVSSWTKKPADSLCVPAAGDSPIITKKPIGSRIVNSRENIDELLSDEDENWDNMSTIATLDKKIGENKHKKRHSRPRITSHSDIFLQSEDETDPFIVTAKTKSGRSYTQGNTTIEKPSDQSCTNIRIGSRSNENTSRISEHWYEIHQQRENTGGIPSRPDKQTISAVSLNMVTNSKDDRTCVNTPALASRPVPTMLRYLSAKQGQNKRK